MQLERKTIRTIIYWNVVFAVLMIALGTSTYLARIHRYDSLIVSISRHNDLDPRMITSLIWSESRFDPNQVGAAGEIGLMQLTETAAREWADQVGNTSFKRDDLFNPDCNLHAGCWYLARAVTFWSKKKSDPIPYALAEYNAGRSNARRWNKDSNQDSHEFWESITYPTTKRYIADILKRYRGGV